LALHHHESTGMLEGIMFDKPVEINAGKAWEQDAGA
jgi:hypothetical protein